PGDGGDGGLERGRLQQSSSGDAAAPGRALGRGSAGPQDGHALTARAVKAGAVSTMLEGQDMKTAFGASLALHVVVIGLTLVGLPFLEPDPLPPEPQVMVVELAPVAEKTNPRPEPQKMEAPKPQPAPPPKAEAPKPPEVKPEPPKP